MRILAVKEISDMVFLQFLWVDINAIFLMTLITISYFKLDCKFYKICIHTKNDTLTFR